MDPIYSAEEFDKFVVAGSLITKSNPTVSSTSRDLDLGTPMKKLQFELQQLDRKIKSLVDENYSQLVADSNATDEAVQAVAALDPSLEHVSASMARLKTEVVQPYAEANALSTTLTNLNRTASLLRSAIFFLYLASILDSQEADFVELASACRQLDFHVESHPELRKLDVVSAYLNGYTKRRDFIAQWSAQIVSHCVNQYKLQQDMQRITLLLQALSMLSLPDVIMCLDKVTESKIATSDQILKRSITSIRTFDTAISDVASECGCLQLSKVLSQVKVNDVTLLQHYLHIKSRRSLVSHFWDSVAASFGKEFTATFKRGGPVGKSLTSNAQSIRDSIKRAVPRSGVDQESPEMEAMLTAVACLP